MTDEDGDVFGLDGFADPEHAPPDPADRADRWRIAAACAAVAVVLAGGVGAAVAATGDPSSSDADSVVFLTTSSSPASSSPVPVTSAPTTPAPTTTSAPTTTTPTPTVPPAQLAAEKAELRQTAAQLTRLRLSSPASWDKWLPAGKPYPGANTAEDISTCPKISSRLTAALGQKMSYWIGTLPMGPNGCDYATPPLDYNGPYTYPYAFEIGYLSGTTTEEWRHHFYEDAGAVCPDIDVPAVGSGAILLRCVGDGTTGYTLVLPDSRRSDGVWILEADTRPTAKHPTSYALTALLDALKAVYG